MKVYDPAALGLQIMSVSGVEAKLRCPFHLDKTPSARFNLSNGLFHCFGCGHSANAYQLAKEFGGELSKIDIALIPRTDYEEREWLQLSYSKLATRSKYLEKRKVTPEQIKEFGILRSKDGILFPIHNKNGTLVGLQERRFSLEPKYMLHGQRTAVWPMSNLRYEYLLLVEGVFGVLRADLFGIPAVCTMGASAIPQAAKVLEGRTIKIVFDDDLAGYLGAYSFMMLHRTSAAVLPGLEVDEASKREFEKKILIKIPERDILGYAIKTENNRLALAIKRKEEQHEVKKARSNKTFGSRRVSVR
jgi:DNA primase